MLLKTESAALLRFPRVVQAARVLLALSLLAAASSARAQVSLVSKSQAQGFATTGGAQSYLAGPPFTITGGGSVNPSQISADGRYVVFESLAPNLVAGMTDTGSRGDIFVRDRVSGTTTLVSRAAGQARSGNGWSSSPSISADGQFVAFISSATDLLPVLVGGPGNLHVFLWSRASDSIVLVSHAAGAPATTANSSSTGRPSISADGRYVAYLSRATNLVAGQSDSNGQDDAFLFDRFSLSSVLVSRTGASAVATGNARTFSPMVSADGSRVVFESNASNLVAGQVDANSVLTDVFLFDRAAGQNTLVSHALISAVTTGNDESGSPALSADGSTVAFYSGASNLVAGTDTFGSADVFLYDAATGVVRLVSHVAGAPTLAAGNSFSPAIDAAGAVVAYVSAATNLVPGQVDPVASTDVFVWLRAGDTTALVTHLPGAPNTAAPEDTGPIGDLRVSSDGSRVLYGSNSNYLTTVNDFFGSRDFFLYTRASGVNRMASAINGGTGDAAGDCAHASLSSSGAFVSFDSFADNVITLGPGQDLNGATDVFLFDLGASKTTLLSAHAAGLDSASAGGESTASTFDAISADGRYAVFTSDAPDLISGGYDGNDATDVFSADLATGEQRLVSHAFGSQELPPFGRSRLPVISADGSRVAFLSDASSALVPGLGDFNQVEDVFLWERATGQVRLVTRNAADPQSTGNGAAAAAFMKISADGRFVLYASRATDLVPGQIDTNAQPDVFLFDASTGQNTLLSHAAGAPATAGNGLASPKGLSADGRYALFVSAASNLVPGQVDPNGGLLDVFLYDRLTATTTLVSRAAGGPATTTANGHSWDAAIGADGSTIVVVSDATNLLAGFIDGNGLGSDVYVLERTSLVARLVTHTSASSNQGANGDSFQVALGAGGQWLSYLSDATNLAAGQTGGGDRTAFLYSVAGDVNVVVSHRAASPTQAGEGGGGTPTLSADGAYVAFASYEDDIVPGQVDGNQGNHDVFLYRRDDGSIRLLSRTPASATSTGNDFAFLPALSADGSAVLFSSAAEDLVARDFNARGDVFVAYNESVPPQNPTLLFSETHTLASWSSGNQIGMRWSGASDAGSGLRGYSVLFDQSPTTTPDTTVDVPHVTPPDPQASSVPLPDGNSHWFHLRTCDNAGNCAGPLHRGPYWIDATPPSAPAGLSSTSHTPGVPSPDTTVDIVWSPSADPTSGVDGYGIAFSFSPTPYCSQVKVVEEGATSFTSEPLGDGNRWAHVCALDNAGNWGPVAVAGPYRIATGADVAVQQSASPEPVSALAEVTFTLGVTNHGGLDASGVTLTDTLPAGLVFVSSTPGPPTCAHAAGTLTCALGALPFLASTDVVVRATSAPGFTGLAQNQAVVAASEPDGDPTNNQSQHDLLVVLAKGDLNNDAAPEILMRNETSGRHVAWLMNGTLKTGGGFITPDPPSPDWQVAAVHDVTFDQRNDLAFRNQVTGEVQFWPMNGLTRIAPPLPLQGGPALGVAWTLQASADFDHDGQFDLLWRNTQTQALTIWRTSGAQYLGTLTPSPDHAVDANWQLVAALDVSDDGNVDFIWYNTTSGRVVQWLMNASVQRIVGRFTNPPSAGNANWKVVGAANYGGDSSPLAPWNDLLWRNETSGKLVVWQMNAQGERLAGLFTTPDAPANALSWRVVGPR